MHLTIRKKIALGIAGTALVSLATGIFSLSSLLKIRTVTANASDSLTSYRAIYTINHLVHTNKTDISDLLNGPDTHGVQSPYKDIDQTDMVMAMRWTWRLRKVSGAGRLS